MDLKMDVSSTSTPLELEPVEPFEHLSLTETVLVAPETMSCESSSFQPQPLFEKSCLLSSTTIQTCTTTLFAAVQPLTDAMPSQEQKTELVLQNTTLEITSYETEAVPTFCTTYSASVSYAEPNLHYLGSTSQTALTVSEFAQSSSTLKPYVEHQSTSRGATSDEVAHFIHRSVSSPIFGSSSLSSAFADENSNGNAVMVTVPQNGTPGKKRKALMGNLKFPEAQPPAVRPRFQWYQGKGVVRIHLLVKNVLPENLKISCTGRDLEFRCVADNCPYPPTRPEIPPRPMVEYHLPLRLQHRVISEPEFTRISPSRIEVYYRKVKQHVEWSCLWKSVSDDRLGVDGNGGTIRDPMDSSSDSEDLEDYSEDEQEQSRPAKRFMNRNGDRPSIEVTITVQQPAASGGLLVISNGDDSDSPKPAIFTIGTGDDADTETSDGPDDTAEVFPMEAKPDLNSSDSNGFVFHTVGYVDHEKLDARENDADGYVTF